MTCDELTHDQLISYLDHELDRDAFMDVRFHLHSCGGCERRLEAVREIVRGIAAGSDAAKPLVPQAMEDALLVEIGNIAAATRGEAVEPRAPVKLRGEWRLSGGQVLGAAVAATLVVLAVGSWLRDALLGGEPAREGDPSASIGKAPDPRTAVTPQPEEKASPKKTAAAPPAVAVVAMEIPPGGETPVTAELAVVWDEPPAPVEEPIAARPADPEPPRSRLRGDVNGDGKVDIADSMLITRALVRKDIALDLDAADVNGDGRVDIADSMYISNQVVAGVR